MTLILIFLVPLPVYMQSIVFGRTLPLRGYTGTAELSHNG